MAAHRKWSDAQRQAMFRLFETGRAPTEIARLCGEGMAGTSPFQVPRRTVHDIVTRMAAEAEQKLPATLIEAESEEAIRRFPDRVARILDTVATRIEGKADPTLKDLDRLSKATEISFAVRKRLDRPSPASEGPKGGGARMGAIEALAQREAEKGRTGERTEAQLQPTRTSPQEPAESEQQPDSGITNAEREGALARLDAVRKNAEKHGLPVDEIDEQIARIRVATSWEEAFVHTYPAAPPEAEPDAPPPSREAQAATTPDEPEPALAADPPGFTPSQERIFAARNRRLEAERKQPADPQGDATPAADDADPPRPTPREEAGTTDSTTDAALG